MAYDKETYEKDPDTNSIKLFFGGLFAILVIMTGIYFFTNMDATNVAHRMPPTGLEAQQAPATPPPSTLR